MKTTVTRHDQRMLRLMNDTRYQYVHATRARRRGLVAAHVALTAGLLATVLAIGALDLGWAALAALVPLLLAWCAVTGMLNMATSGLLELRARVLDERQLAERGRAFVRAHRASLVLQAAVLLWMLLAHDGGDARLPAGVLAGAVVVLVAVHGLLPLWIAAFTTSDAPAEDD